LSSYPETKTPVDIIDRIIFKIAVECQERQPEDKKVKAKISSSRRLEDITPHLVN
jgi:hypothetical protein